MAVAGIFGAVPDARAWSMAEMLQDGALAAVGGIVKIWVWVIGQLVVQLVYLIIYLASYNNFVNSSAVENGWVIIRDVVNMFFIIILLVIAFATIFNVKEYKYQAMLPRLLIMAVVINFSRTICGVLIDFGQVVMLTFVNGFQAAAGGNFVKALKIEELMQFKENAASTDTSFQKVLASFILAALMITITAVVLGAFAIMLVMRMVMLWFLIVLSPIAFLASVWPSGRIKQKYSMWWDAFLDNIMIGPILAFFLWLSLLVLGNGDMGTEVKTGGTYQKATGEVTEVSEPSVGYTKVGTTDNMLSYLLGIGMLIGSLAMAQGMRSAGGGIAGAALGKIKGYATAGVKRVAIGAPMWAGRKAGEGALRAGEGAALPILGGLSKLPPILGGGLALKGAARIQQRKQERAKKQSAWTATLTPEQRAQRLGQLEGIPPTLRREQQKNELAALYRERLGDLGREGWKPDKNGLMNSKTKDEWYKEKQKEYAKISEFSSAYKATDPVLRKEALAFEDQRMDFLSSVDRKKKASELTTLQATAMSLKVLQNDDVVEDMGKENRDAVKATGGKARKDLIEDWERRHGVTPAPSPTPPAAPTPTPTSTPTPAPTPSGSTPTGGTPPPAPPMPPIAPPPPKTPPPRPTGGGTPVTPPSAPPTTPPPAGGITPIAPPPASATPQEKIDFLAQGGPVENVYQVDVAGNFENNEAAEQFKTEWKELKESLSKDNIGKLFSTINGLKGEMGKIATQSLNKNDFGDYMSMLRRTGAFGKGDSDEQSLKKTIRKYMLESEVNKDTPEVKGTREYIENNSITNQYISEGEEEEKA